MKRIINKLKVPDSLVKCNEKISEAIRKQEKKEVKHRFEEDVRKQLGDSYNYKCAYCESDIRATGFHIEHYRPKGRVTGEEHTGYYWLTCEWTNLLLACPTCNGKKSTSFPIKGKRVFNAPLDNNERLDKKKCKVDYIDLVNEKPQILNPENKYFNPLSHFIISPNGTIKELSEAGKITKKCCDLNREGLVYKRKKIVENHRVSFVKHLKKYKERKINQTTLFELIKNEITKITERIIKDEPYTLLAKYMLKYFDKFFINRFQPEEQRLLKNAYNQYIIDLKKQLS